MLAGCADSTALAGVGLARALGGRASPLLVYIRPTLLGACTPIQRRQGLSGAVIFVRTSLRINCMVIAHQFWVHTAHHCPPQ